MRWLLITLFLLSGAFTIRVYPLVVPAGGTVKITCHVPDLPPSSQDTLEVGIEGFTSSVFEIHSTPWTKDTLFDHVPCGSDTAFCACVTDTDTHIARQPILVAGCEDDR
jgi:hypothetical protein